ncbi:NAD-dependent histone deacetylase SIR2 [Rhizoctonia solani]|uniref:NAD-dependent histone deacetylase SIR2 n=1 Tax=Rhizoctonia solani TaxID=456999 RepID=A0A8H8T0N6_9AGAM|nr:NAD-dependent histone deacetylase SIR2 [Rhizoctonia solani]QRW23653.1 NAD-dependent histone deacetylase SIR2 [Rhizoctonia solani]
MSDSNLLARLAEILRRQQQQPRDGSIDGDEDEDDTRHTMTAEELEEAQRLLWQYIADPHGSDGTVPREDPKVLETRDLAGIANYLKSGTGYGSGKKKVVLMVGISTSAGIPDFRSPKTGLYANLARLNLPYPEAVFDIHFFEQNPLPFYTLAHELYPGKFRPTVTHSFIKLLSDKGMLQMCFTQNIDTLERLAGVPASQLVEAHGSFAENHCISCGAEFPADEMRELVMAKNPDVPGGVNVPRCKKPNCGGLVKPDIVFFGESLPERFHESLSLLPFADLALVIGTSLTVHPFARLPQMVSDRCPRALLNMETAGQFNRADDVIHLAPCDDAVRELCDLLGWRDELEKLWAETENIVAGPSTSTQPGPDKTEDDLAVLMDKALNLNAAEKNAEDVAEKTAATTESARPGPNAQKATASIRVSLAWLPEPAPVPDEESVLVLTAPTGQYVDIRIKLARTDSSTATSQLSETPINDPSNVPSDSNLSWGFAGIASRTSDGKGGRWSRVVDSRTADPAGETDEGQEETLPNGDTKESGTMDGKAYIEVWRSLDVGSSPEVWVSEKKDVGMVVRVGEWAQGVVRNGDQVSVFRARFKDDSWVDVYRVGSVEVFPAIGGSLEGWDVLGDLAETKL